MILADFINSISELKDSNELIFFGGSFNPWHEGHGSCLRLYNEENPIIVIPDHNPYKELVLTNEKLSGVEEIKNELSQIDTKTYLFDQFMQQDTKNPSHVWIRNLKEKLPKTKISLLMGFDTFIGLDKWINAEKVLCDLSRIYIASRLDNQEIKEKQFHLLKSINPNLDIVFLGHHDFEELSSSKLRQRAKE